MNEHRNRAVGLLVVALLAAALASPASGTDAARPSRLEAPVLAFSPLFLSQTLRTAALGADGVRSLRHGAWWGGTYTVPSGEQVTVFVSDAYPVDNALAQRWAAFFASLLHGRELATLRAYVAPIAEVQRMCGSEDVLGCYGAGMLVTIGDTTDGVPPAFVATHEYGHHIAANRINPPWVAVDWGTKRWASYVNVCARAKNGTAFPGNEGADYRLNPGEGFAESYRILSESRAGATSFVWPVVDRSFYPDSTALAQIAEDVVHPWTGTTTRTVAGRFRRRGIRTWVLPLTTALDGALSVTLRLAAGAGYDLSLVGPDHRTVLERGLWSQTGEKSLEHVVCGQRGLTVRVVRRGPPARFSVRVDVP
jgi:hypothetical protein